MGSCFACFARPPSPYSQCPPQPPPDPYSQCPPQPPSHDKQQLGIIEDATQLDPLIDHIEQLLSSIKKEQPAQRIKPESSKMREFVTDNVEIASKLLQYISTESEALHKSNLASKFPEEMEKVVYTYLEGCGKLHWIAVGFSMIAFALEKIQQVSSNFEKCVELLDTMFDLAKRLQGQYRRMPNDTEMLNKAVLAIVEGVITCCSCMTQENLFEYLFSSSVENLERIESYIEKVRMELSPMIMMDIQEQISRRHFVSEYRRPVHAVGMDDRVEEVIKLLDLRGKAQRRAVILYGFSGIGKTTLADCVMSQLDLTGFKHSRIYLDDKQSDIKSYQEQLIEDLTSERLQFTDSVEGRDKLKEVLETESTLIFIDNALRQDQINDLFSPVLFLPYESRMLLTTRNIRVVDELRDRHIDCKIYRVQQLPRDAANEFFREIVRRGKPTNSEAPSLSLDKMDAVAEQCHGVPLLLRVYARYLARYDDPEVCDEMLAMLRMGDFSYLDDSLGDKLLYVYHQFPQGYKDAFVDICTYFHGWEKKDVSFILGKRQLSALVDAAFVNIDSSGNVTVHDVLRDMGIKLGEGTRLRSANDWKRAMDEENVESHGIKGMWLLDSEDGFNIESRHVRTVSESLRVLAVGGQIRLTGECRVSVPNLIFLQIENFQGDLPSFCRMPALRYTVIRTRKSSSTSLQRLCENIQRMENIEKLVLQNSELVELPDDFKLASSLIELDLSYCRGLHVLPDGLCKLEALQSLNMWWCESLQCLPDDFPHLRALQSLDLHGCRNLASLPNGFHNLVALRSLNLQGCERLRSLSEGFCLLSALELLDLRRCKNLESLPDGFGMLGALQSLDLQECTSLESLPDGFGELRALRSLNLRRCLRLTNLPDDFVELRALQSLDLQGCRSLTMLPDEFGMLRALRSLDLKRCTSLVSLPEGFGMLSALQSLDLKGCSSLTILPYDCGELGALQSLSLQRCKSLASLPFGFGNLKSLQSLDLWQCYSLESLPDGFGDLEALQSLRLGRCNKLTSLPKDFSHLGALQSLDLAGCERLQSLPNEFGDLSALQLLDLQECKMLVSLPCGFGNLNTLEVLYLQGCSSLVSLPDGFGNLKSLKSLYLQECSSLVKLPNGFGNLKSLKSLYLQECGSLMSLPDGFGELNNLQHLNIANCSQLKTLPDDFERLRLVEYLNLSCCPNLEGSVMGKIVKLENLRWLEIKHSTELKMEWKGMERGKFSFIVQGAEDDRLLERSCY